MNVLVMAGTSDAVNLIKILKSKKGINVIATTVTDYGARIALKAGADEVISVPLDKNDLINTVKANNIKVLADATHPYATLATKNAIKASKESNIRFYRLERPITEYDSDELINKVPSFSHAAQIIGKMGNVRILHLAGVSTIKQLFPYLNPSSIIVRVLPSANSIERCLEVNIPPENIIAMQGTFSIEFNQILMNEFQVDAIITKDSGDSGGTPSKIAAALNLGIPVFLVERPVISELNPQNVFNTPENLTKKIFEDL